MTLQRNKLRVRYCDVGGRFFFCKQKVSDSVRRAVRAVWRRKQRTRGDVFLFFDDENTSRGRAKPRFIKTENSPKSTENLPKSTPLRTHFFPDDHFYGRDFCFSLASRHPTYVVRDRLPSFVSRTTPPPCKSPFDSFYPLSSQKRVFTPPPLLRPGNASTTVRFILCLRGPGEPYKTSGTDSPTRSRPFSKRLFCALSPPLISALIASFVYFARFRTLESTWQITIAKIHRGTTTSFNDNSNYRQTSW